MLNIREMESFFCGAVKDLGLKVLKCTFWRNQKNVPSIDIIIENNSGVSTLKDCSEANKIAMLWLKKEGFAGKVNLCVRVPGIDRELFTLEDFQRFKGSNIRVTFKELMAGRRRVEGIIQSAELDSITLVKDSNVCKFHLENVEKANIIPDWKSVMKKRLQ